MPNTAPRPAVVALLRRMRLELMRARLAYDCAKQMLGDQVRSNYAVSMALLQQRGRRPVARLAGAYAGDLGLFGAVDQSRPAGASDTDDCGRVSAQCHAKRSHSGSD